MCLKFCSSKNIQYKGIHKHYGVRKGILCLHFNKFLQSRKKKAEKLNDVTVWCLFCLCDQQL